MQDPASAASGQCQVGEERDMVRKIAFSLCVVWAAQVNGARAEEPAPEASQSAAGQAIVEAIRQLGDESFAVREQAQRKLVAIGAPAVTALRAAADSSDPEVARRARNVLRSVRGKLHPQVPIRFALSHTGGLEKNGPRVSPDGKLKVKVLDTRSVQLVEADSGKPRGPVLSHANRRSDMSIRTWAFSANGKLLVTASSDGGGSDTAGEVRVWDVKSGALLAAATDADHDLGHVHAVAFTDEKGTVKVDCEQVSGR